HTSGSIPTRTLIAEGYQRPGALAYETKHTINPAAMPADQRETFSKAIGKQGSNGGFNLLKYNPKAPILTDRVTIYDFVVAQLALLGWDALNCVDHLQNPPDVREIIHLEKKELRAFANGRHHQQGDSIARLRANQA
ncbi:hypothetical protein FPRO04_14610, partial [Fusarium proliferatum]